MIRVLYDRQIFRIQKFGGISRYFAELIKGINNTPGFKSIPGKYYSDNKHLRSNNLTYLDDLNNSAPFKGKSRIESYIVKNEEKKTARIFKEGNFDLFHPTYYTPSQIELLPKSKPLVLTVYDMIHELYYEKHTNSVHSDSISKRDLILKADHIVAISQNTKDDILHFFPSINKDNITVIYLGSSISPSVKPAILSLPRKYILFVGHRGAYKNFTWLLQSVAAYLTRNNITLVCAGSGNFSQDEIEMINKAGVSHNIKYMDISNDNDLVALYKGAACFVFPSLFEGFGIPILEAFSCDCPVIIPNKSCFPEIAGDAALYYEAGNQDDLLQQLERILNDTQLPAALCVAGRNRLKLFSWEQTVKDHIKLYKSLCSN